MNLAELRYRLLDLCDTIEDEAALHEALQRLRDDALRESRALAGMANMIGGVLDKHELRP